MSLKRHALIAPFALIAALLFSAPTRADVIELRPDHPERYTVVKGDTLWDIAARFLKDPWRWPNIWNKNDQVRNPHLIYPGDVLVLRFVDGRPVIGLEQPGAAPAPSTDTLSAPPVVSGPTESDGRTVKLRPEVRRESLDAAIPTIKPDVIGPFLTQPLAIDANQLRDAGYVTVGLDNRVALANLSEFYARGLGAKPADRYQVFRPGKALRHPDTNELLAYEALYLGEARLLDAGDPAKLEVTSVKQEIVPTDRLVVAPTDAPLPYYFPRAPEKQVNGRIISVINGVAEFGPGAVVGISLGKREGMAEGHVLRIMRHAGKHRDPVTGQRYKLPDEQSGLLIVFRTFEKVSYGLIVNATRPVHILDAVRTP